MKTINTVYCAATTPMNRDQSIDYAGLTQNIRWYREQGLGGILICGGTGEFVSLSDAERLELVERSAQEINGECGFMVGCASETTADAIRYAKHAEANGADALLLIASYYFKPSVAELLAHMRAVADSVTLPVVLYNNPGSCGSDLTPDLVQELSCVPNIYAIKEATGNLDRAKQLLNMHLKDFDIFCGCDYLINDIIKAGGSGWVSITANALPSQSQEIFDALRAGDVVRADKLFRTYKSLYEICETPYKAVQTVKYMMDRLGLVGGFSRLPRLPLTEEEKLHVDALMRGAGLSLC